jgi:DNA-binding CsgD family transcriptional regulator
MNENPAVLLTPRGREILARVADKPWGLICADPAARLG